MKSKLTFNRHYFIIALLLLGIEVLIAQFAHDPIIRPYVGDFLVVILIYCFVKSFLATPYFSTAIAVLIFSFSLEFLQYFDIVTKLGLGHSKLARTVIGTSFEFIDLVAYTLGILLVIYWENKLYKKNLKSNALV